MNCKQCGKELTGKSSYCSDSCRTVYNRNKRNTKPEQIAAGTSPEQSIKQKLTTVSNPEPAEIEETANQVHYAPRTSPELINFGPWMNSDELKRAGLKANRVPIPGDWDYAGVCVKTEAGWQVANQEAIPC